MELFDFAAEERIQELSRLIKKYQDSYYNGEGEISDSEFDALWDELKTLDSENPLFKKVGADSGNFSKIRHIMPMGSQEKAANPEQFLNWAKNHIYDEYLVEYKLDGASLELQYQNGELLRAVTRGDGNTGDEITENAKKMEGVKTALYDKELNKIDFTGAVRGEVIMKHVIHEKYYSDKANCRNAANGLMKRKDGNGCENLTLIVYDALSTEGKSPFSDEKEKIEWLSSAGFFTSPLYIAKTAQDVISYRSEVMEIRKNLDYDIDGLVIKEKKINMDDAWRARPDRQIAFKFSLEEAVTVLRNVEWSESGATYTPIALFDPVSLNGTTVQRASLANPDTMRNLGVKIGSRIVVVKRGEIIPKVESVIKEENEETRDVIYPETCSCCGSKLVDDGSRLFCPDKSCAKRVLHQIQKWISVVDIRDFGETLIKSLFDDRVLKSISDIYKLTVEDLTPYFLNEESLESQKISLGAKKVFESIHSRTSMTLAVFLAGFDIEGLGETMIQKVVDAGFNTLEKIFSACESDISGIYGFAEITAKIFVEGINENKEEMLFLTENNLIRLEDSEGGSLQGKSFCFTGELKTMKRSDAEALVKQNRGSCKSSVTKDLTYLVTNDIASGSSKNKKASQYGIPIINEEEFLKLVK